MNQQEFGELCVGDEVVFENNDTVHTVLGYKKEVYSTFVPVHELVVSLSPSDDNYVRRVGMFDQDVARMSRVDKGE